MSSSVLSAAVQPYIDRGELAGAVMWVADRAGMLAVETVGWSDLEGRREMMPGTSFWIASQTKPVTAAALMMLVEEGRLSIDDPVGKYLPSLADWKYIARRDDDEILLKKPSRPVTIKDLLIHASGLPFKSLIEDPSLDLHSLTTLVQSYAMCNLEFDPGEKFLYSNAGYNVVARIMEIVTGQRYEAFIDERIIGPLGMRDTTFWPDSMQAAHLAAPYEYKDGRLERTSLDAYLRYPLTEASRCPMPAGGLFSTAHDVATLYRMFLNEGSLGGRTYLSPATVGEMCRRQTPENWPEARGLGFASCGDVVGHAGAFGSDTQLHRGRGLILGWLIQHAGSDVGPAKEAFFQAALEHFGGGQ